ncbi:MAG: hypothetical protein ABWZ15_02230 [Acidimicrobiia bacterium]
MDTAVATQVAEDVLATARGTLDDVIESVRDYTIDVAERAREAKAPKKKRHPFVTLLVLIGLGALAFVVIKRLTAAEEDAAETLDAVTDDVIAPVSV